MAVLRTESGRTITADIVDETGAILGQTTIKIGPNIRQLQLGPEFVCEWMRLGVRLPSPGASIKIELVS